MTAVKERIIGAVSIMSDKDANIFWHIIQKHFKLPDTFADIEKVEPDETDLIMLKEIEFDGLSKWFNLPENLSLPYKNNHLTFSFIGVHMQSRNHLKYQY